MRYVILSLFIMACTAVKADEAVTSYAGITIVPAETAGSNLTYARYEINWIEMRSKFYDLERRIDILEAKNQLHNGFPLQ